MPFYFKLKLNFALFLFSFLGGAGFSFREFSLGIPYRSSLRGVSETNDEAISFIKPFYEAPNEIASAFSKPRNDGILGILD